jgi:hypothetical protein
MKEEFITSKSSMKRYFYSGILFLTIFTSSYAQRAVISGFVMDLETQEALIGANVFETTRVFGATTNNHGFYSLSVPMGDSIQLTYSYLGYQNHTIRISLSKNTKCDIALQPGTALEEVTVVGKRSVENLSNLSLTSIPIEQIKAMPTLFGETDILRAYQLMPGIQTGKEGTSGIHVRGGSSDQNLFLLDGVPLYNVNHIGGFLSTFDPEAINSAKIYKGGFPARYGGRLSSVVDIRMKRGNMRKRKTEVQMGVLSSKFSVESPIKSDTSSFFVSIRRCNVDIITRMASLRNSDGAAMAGYTFYDLYGTANRKLSEKDQVFFSIFHGADRVFLSLREKASDTSPYTHRASFNQRWGNTMIATRYNRVFTQNLFGDFIIAYTGYSSGTSLSTKSKGENVSERSSINLNSGVYDLVTSANFDYYHSNYHKILFGIEGLYHTFNPGTSSHSSSQPSDVNQVATDLFRTKTVEFKGYLEDRLKLLNVFDLNLGLHFGSYQSYDQAAFFSIQPRASINYPVNESLSLNAGYAKMWQCSHLLTLSSSALPTDFWIPASSSLPPQKGHQYTLGFEKSVHQGSLLSLGVETFYKTMSSLIEAKEGASLFGSTETWLNNIEPNGKGLVYGVEVLLYKKAGSTTGWIGYTWSKNERQFDNINNGKPFPFIYDRRHDMSIVVNHEISKNIRFSCAWVYSSGNPITFPQQHYMVFASGFTSTEELITVHLYEGRNSYRMPSYHRLDISFNFSKEKLNGVRTWSIGLYNAYSRFNPFFQYYKYDQDMGKYRLYQFSLFPILPSISYAFVFQ